MRKPPGQFMIRVAVVVGTALGAAAARPAAAGESPQIIRFDGGAYDRAGAITVDGAGNSYLAGAVDEGGGGSSFAVVKLGPDGTQRWAQRYDGPGVNADFAEQVVVDAAGDVYATGFSYGADFDNDWATLKFAADGTLRWERRRRVGRTTALPTWRCCPAAASSSPA